MFNPSPCRHARFRRSRVLIVGCGDVGSRVAKALAGRHVLALTSQPDKCATLRAAGIRPLIGNLDDPGTLGRLAGLATRVLHLAPPPGQGHQDSRTAHLMHALARRGGVHQFVYGSTTGVYGHAQGAWLDETATLTPQTDRARRRVDAEACVKAWGRTMGAGVSILRIPGIYGFDREGGDPRERVRRGSPVLCADEDVWTNHIHADDLARACVRALWLAKPGRAINVCDETRLKMGDYFDMIADAFGLSRPPRVTKEEAQTMLSPMQRSFMGESRRLSNLRMKTELRLPLRYPQVRDACDAYLGAAVLGEK